MGQIGNTGPEASRPRYLMYTNVSEPAGKYRLGDGSSFCWGRDGHVGSAYILYDHHAVTQAESTGQVIQPCRSMKSHQPLQGREWMRYICASWTLAQATCPYITKSDERCWAHTPDPVGLNVIPIEGLIRYPAYRCSVCHCY